MIFKRARVSIGPAVAVKLVLLCRSAAPQAQIAAFGEMFPAGQLAAVGNCDALRAGEGVSVLNNPTHAAWGATWSFAGGYRRLYELEYLQRVWGAAKYHRDHWGAAFTVTRLGKEEFYTETDAAFAFALRPWRRLAIGMDLHNLRLAYTTEAPTYSGWSCGAGAIWSPISALVAAGSIRNAIKQDFIPGYRVPRQYNLSVAVSLPGNVQLGTGWLKSEGARAIFGLGQRIAVASNFNFLSAVYFNPARYALGAEFVLRGQALSYTYLSHPDLGGTHYIEFALNPRGMSVDQEKLQR